MRVRDLIGETLESLAANRARSLLTILGIVVGISAVIVMVAIGNGTRASIEDQINSLGSNLLTVSSAGGGGGVKPLSLERSGRTSAGSQLSLPRPRGSSPWSRIPTALPSRSWVSRLSTPVCEASRHRSEHG